MKIKCIIPLLFILFLFVVLASAVAAYSTSSTSFTGSAGLASAGNSFSSSSYTGSSNSGGVSSSYSSTSFSGSVRSSGTSSSTSSSSSTSTTSSGTSGGSSSSPGGGATGVTSLVGSDFEQLLSVGSQVRLTYENTNYLLTITGITPRDMTFTLLGKTYIANLNEIKFIDLTGDVSDDFKIKVVDVSDGKARAGISFLHDATAKAALFTGDVTEPVKTNVSSLASPLQESTDLEKKGEVSADTHTSSSSEEPVGSEPVEIKTGGEPALEDEETSSFFSEKVSVVFLVIAVVALFIFFFGKPLLSRFRKTSKVK